MRSRILFPIGVVVLGLSVGACDAPASTDTARPTRPTIQLGQTDLGKAVTDAQGRTLYAFVPDKGAAACDAACTATWPALTVARRATTGAGLTASLLTITDRDGAKQVTYNKWPLYYYAGDARAGDASGEGIDNEWFAVTVDGKLLKQSR